MYRQFPARVPSNYTAEHWAVQESIGTTKLGLGRSAFTQGTYQMIALVTTLAFAVIGGLITGLQLITFNNIRTSKKYFSIRALLAAANFQPGGSKPTDGRSVLKDLFRRVPLLTNDAVN